VIDLGGVHAAETGSVVLDTLGLTVGNTYNLDTFYAERHTSGSDFVGNLHCVEENLHQDNYIKIKLLNLRNISCILVEIIRP